MPAFAVGCSLVVEAPDKQAAEDALAGAVATISLPVRVAIANTVAIEVGDSEIEASEIKDVKPADEAAA